MPDEKSGTNWYFGLDKILSPSFEFVGFKIRDKLRVWLSKRTRERAVLRNLAIGLIYRRMDLLDYSREQYPYALDSMGEEMLDEQFKTLLPMMREAVHRDKIPLERALEILHLGQGHGDPTGLTGGELILYTASASITNMIVMTHISKELYDYVYLPLSMFEQNPAISDEEIEQTMMANAIENYSAETCPEGEIYVDQNLFTKRCAKTLAEIYSLPFDEAEFDRRCLEGGEESAQENQ